MMVFSPVSNNTFPALKGCALRDPIVPERACRAGVNGVCSGKTIDIHLITNTGTINCYCVQRGSVLISEGSYQLTSPAQDIPVELPDLDAHSASSWGRAAQADHRGEPPCRRDHRENPSL